MSRYQDKILDIINQSCQHLSAEQVYFKLKETCPTVALATVYNNLNALCASGKIKRISVEGKKDCFDKNTVHDHLVCDICQELTDIDLPDLTASLKEMSHEDVRSYDLKLHWICPICRAKSSQH